MTFLKEISKNALLLGHPINIEMFHLGTPCRSASREEGTVDGFEGALRNSKSERRNERERERRDGRD